ncbi:MAG: threonine--tRNA ligase [Deltaproteobacteria bacterium]|nr:MAG: threonine--tRNA ligase [Deltaproteobacteria bacterium]
MENKETASSKKIITEKGRTLKDLLAGPDIIAARVDGRLVDLSTRLDEGKEVEPISVHSKEGLEILRHSTAHVMAEAVKALFPDARPTIGPATDDGFYYDFDRDKPFSYEDLAIIEKKMSEIIAADKPFSRKEISKEDAIRYFAEQNEPYKVEILNDIEDDTVSLYTQGDFTDLCRGPHIPSTGYIKAFKLLSVAGAYWRGDERNKMLQRIYGTAFASKDELDDYLDFLEESKKRDHRRLGRELELFMMSDEVGPGLIIYLPKGGMVRSILEDFEKRLHLKRGYNIVYGPGILRGELWKISGHMDNYRENMYFTEVDNQLYGIKPMNCLAHILIYRSKIRSYRDLPLRYFELGTVTRHEKSGVLHGLLRVRQFTQDDAHIFCMPDQLIDEIVSIINLVDEVMALFGFDYETEISTRPEKSIGTDEDWELATSALKQALETKGLDYDINEGDGAFYGPKIDIKLKDAIGRKWQCATIQCDFSLPQRFDLSYIGQDGRKHRPVMLHRVVLGTIERFMGVLIEHYAGAFPVWLAPVQVVVMSITDAQRGYAQGIVEKLKENDIRAELDARNEKIGYKVREARSMKVPYMAIVGQREMDEDTITLRDRSGRQEKMSIDGLISRINSSVPKI